MNEALNHPIVLESFAIIDRGVGSHTFSPAEYAIVRRVIHSSGDFEFKDLVQFSPGAIDQALEALRAGIPIVTDVTMVRQGIQRLTQATFANPLITALDHNPTAAPGKTRTETGILHCLDQYPGAIYAIGNAPTALLALCEQVDQGQAQPALVIGGPVGFVSVLESKQALAQLLVPQIRVEGHKGGSAVVAAIVNALILLATD
jgi:precorrin-8X/cobalt-precorrin-8 methylmutase